ncbi:MAG: hypothetical protein QM730_11400 [Anaerolineales bacterium]
MKQPLGKALLLTFTSFLLYRSCLAFQKIAWGTGNWWGEYSLKWAFAYFLYCAFCLFVVFVEATLLFYPERLLQRLQIPIAFRERLGIVRWVLALIIFGFPAWLFQYSPWGIVFKDVYIRILIWLLVAAILTFLFTRGKLVFGWGEALLAVLITSGEFVIVASFMDVTSYPFSLGWSEGNCLWDYSIMFGRYLYEYPADKNIPVLLDVGRQFIGGLPFLIHGITIGMERFWVGLTVILPYLLLGFAAFRSARKNWLLYVLSALWTLLFLKQGPIHPPLVLCAVVVALSWRSPLWLAIPLIALTGYAAEESRYTWLFAPGIWIGMLELVGAELQHGKLSCSAWVRTITLGLVGVTGGFFGPKVASVISGLVTGNAAGAPATAVTVTSVSTAVTNQPLLWYRLLPNATYGVGIIVGLLIATIPLIVVLSYLVISKKWKLNIWQGLAIVAPLLAFLLVGLTVSAKIGGGGDLHNMDMFLIGLLFTAVIAWEKAGRDWLTNIDLAPFGMKLILVLMLTLPGLQSLGVMRSYNSVEDPSWLVTLTDVANASKLDLYPSKEIADTSLEVIRQKVALARSQGGDVLFMDQRQLLTFGFISDVPLIPQYEKKVLMNQALKSDAKYFKAYYADLAAKRFSLIVSEPLRKPVKDSSYQFGEENNAWVKWVSIPTLCYYEPKIALDEIGVELLFPREDTSSCSSILPDGSTP